MAGEDQAEPEAIQNVSLRSRATKRVLLVLGVLHVYNIFAHRQTLIDLSQSVQFLAAWWRYLTGLPFEWLHLDFSPLQREIIVLIMFFSSAANLASRRGKDTSFLGRVWKSFRATSDPFEPLAELVQNQMPDPERLTQDVLGKGERWFV